MVATSTLSTTRSSRRVNVTESRALWRRLDWILVMSAAALLVIGSLLVWSATAGNSALTGNHPTSFLVHHLTNIAIGTVLAVVIAATDRRWVRIWAPLVYLGGIVPAGRAAPSPCAAPSSAATSAAGRSATLPPILRLATISDPSTASTPCD